MNWRAAVHGIAIAAFGYIFAYAGLYKVIGHRGMMEGMRELGFGPIPTLLIGVAEVLGVVGIAVGVVARPRLKNLAVLLLLPFANGAFAVHMSHHDGFAEFKESLAACLLGVIALASDRHFRITLG